MKVLVACEFSGIVREAFAKRGHNAWSCDLLPTEQKGNHIQSNVLLLLRDGWDLMIAHPPCQYLAYSGIAHWANPGRCKKRLEALEFFRQLWEAKIDKICIENPKGCASPTIAKYSQVIQPYFFGDNQIKTTWLWLKHLDNLIKTTPNAKKPAPFSITKNNKARYFIDGATRDPHIRSKTFKGIAEAMANQWG